MNKASPELCYLAKTFYKLKFGTNENLDQIWCGWIIKIIKIIWVEKCLFMKQKCYQNDYISIYVDYLKRSVAKKWTFSEVFSYSSHIILRDLLSTYNKIVLHESMELTKIAFWQAFYLCIKANFNDSAHVSSV